MMINNKIYNIYNELFNTMLENDNTNVVKGRFNIENLSIQQKADYIFDLIKSFSTDYKICRIFFWGKRRKDNVFYKEIREEELSHIKLLSGKRCSWNMHSEY